MNFTKKSIIATSFLLLIIKCSPRKEESLKIPDSFISVTNTQTAIISYDSLKHQFLKNSKPTNLSSDEIIILDSILANCVADYNLKIKRTSTDTVQRDAERILIDLKKYNRQYIPVVTSNNEKEVYVNCLCRVSNNDYWKQELITVKDGGSCYFQVKINLSKVTYYDMYVNGDA